MSNNQQTIPDAQQRQQALDHSQSYIVQAPAGSGKTELLTQRFLKLLSTVNQPENILAITFTNKAAAEMQDRTIKALSKAKNNPKPTQAHELLTYTLATQVLERDKQQQWHLLENPNRLGISTIDAFCYKLTHNLPIKSKFGAKISLANNIDKLHVAAAERTLALLNSDSQWAEALTTLYRHLDNNSNRIKQLIISMLAKRDQWLPLITKHNQKDDLRPYLEQELAYVNQTMLTAFGDCITPEIAGELLSLVNYASSNLYENDDYKALSTATELPDTCPEQKSKWQLIWKLFLTSKLEWRKQGTAKQGFPAPSNATNKAEKDLFSSWKKRYKSLVEQLNCDQDITHYIQEFMTAPDCTYTDEQWEVLSALLIVLPLAAAQLKLVFCENSSIDYVENSLAALDALGDIDAPTDLALVLDYKLQHLLVDEFQDTSINQFLLISKLLTGWQENDGRTLFLVGDPMQSIYRFREAEVGLFLRVKFFGIADIKPTPLTLNANFRSEEAVIDWVNEVFTHAMPATQDISAGKISYSPSHACKPTQTKSSIHYHALTANEALKVVELIKDEKTSHPDHSIAILVRARTHLLQILPALKQHAIEYKAVEIERLNQRQIIMDLCSLTKALLHLNAKTEWLAILRAPWCGLSLTDLTIIANHATDTTLWGSASTDEVQKQLSSDGQVRLAAFCDKIDESIKQRYRLPLRDWVEMTWHNLQGYDCIEPTESDDAQAFFELLETFHQDARLIDFNELDQKIALLFASATDLTNANPVQVMTIHKAKGLEFDTIILPGMDKRTGQSEKQLLQWLEYPDENSINHLLIAPIHQRNREEATYRYIEKKQKEKFEFEYSRLLYVALTRAKKQIHLLANLSLDEQGNFLTPDKSSLLSLIWPVVAKNFSNSQAALDMPDEKSDNPHKATLKRLSLKHLVTDIKHEPYSIDTSNLPTLELNDPNSLASIGTLVHLLIQRLTDLDANWWNEQTNETKHAFINATAIHNKLQGMYASNKKTAFQAIENLYHDEQGRWLMQPHPEAASELSVTIKNKGKLKTLIVDRTFIDENNIRWIIDFKTSTPTTDESTEEFIARETNTYKQQLKNYQQALTEIDDRLIKTALYFPLIPAFTLTE